MKRTKIMYGKDVADDLLRGCKTGDRKILNVVQVGNNEDSNIYVGRKRAKCEELGYTFNHYLLPTSSTTKSVVNVINDIVKIGGGIIVQLPLPPHINETEIMKAIPQSMDVDGFSSYNLGKLLTGESGGFTPCTPMGVMKMLDYYNCFYKDCMRVVIIGRSNVVGLPLANLLIKRGCQVTVLNSNSTPKNTVDNILNCDILITATNIPKMVNYEYLEQVGYSRDTIKEKLNNIIAVDVGIFRVDGKVCGNISSELYNDFLAITPVPRGVGVMTVACLLYNVSKCEVK